MKKQFLIIALLFVFAMGEGLAQYTLKTWVGQSSQTSQYKNRWNYAYNWFPAGVPSASNNVTIPVKSHGNYPTQFYNIDKMEVNNLTIDDGAYCEVPSGCRLAVNNTFDNNSGVDGLIVKYGGSFYNNTSGEVGTLEFSYPAYEWHLVSSPITDGLIGVFEDPNLHMYLYSWEEPDYDPNVSGSGMNDQDDVNLPFVTTRGYYAGYNPSSSGTFDMAYEGTLATADDTTTLWFTSGNDDPGWNIVGNPYPCYVDWNAAGWDKSDVEPYIQFFQPVGSDWDGIFHYYLPSSGDIEAVELPGSVTGLNYIAPGTAFWVRAKNAGSFGISSTCKTKNIGPVNEFKGSSVPSKKIRLECDGVEVLIRWSSTLYTMDYDEGADIYWTENSSGSNLWNVSPHGDELVVNTRQRPTPYASLQYNISFKPDANGTYYMTTTDFNLPDGAYAYIRDWEEYNPPWNMAVYYLDGDDSYEFDATTSDDLDRFTLYVVFDYPPAAESFDGIPEKSSLPIQEFGQVVKIFNIMGQVVESNFDELEPGVYILMDEEGRSKKITR